MLVQSTLLIWYLNNIFCPILYFYLHGSEVERGQMIFFFQCIFIQKLFLFQISLMSPLLSPCRKVASGIWLALYFLSAWIWSLDDANDINLFKNYNYFKCHWCRDLLSPCRKVTSGILLALYFLSAWICNNRDVANDIQFFNTNLFKNDFYFNCH